MERILKVAAMAGGRTRPSASVRTGLVQLPRRAPARLAAESGKEISIGETREETGERGNHKGTRVLGLMIDPGLLEILVSILLEP